MDLDGGGANAASEKNAASSSITTPTKRTEKHDDDDNDQDANLQQVKKPRTTTASTATSSDPVLVDIPSTPPQNIDTPTTPTTPKTPKSASKGSAEKPKLSKEERKRLKEQAEKEKEERRLKREEDKKKRDEEKAKKEEEKKRREEERAKKAEEKAKIEREKEEEKKKREEERAKKEEERKKKEEERLGQKRKKEEEHAAKEKTLHSQQNLIMAFVKKAAAKPAPAHDEWTPYLSYSHPNGLFLPMARPPRTTIAPILRTPPTNVDPLTQPASSLAQWKKTWQEKRWRKRRPRGWMMSLIGVNTRSLSNIKFFFFHDNENKPIFYGTWSKKSLLIKPRRPCHSRDETLVDYVFDSDAEWVEEDAGESVSKDDEEEPEENPDSDDELAIVPDGYLSPEEGLLSEDEEDELPDAMKEQQGAGDEGEALERRKRMRDEAKAALYKERKDSVTPLRLGVYLGEIPQEEAKSQAILKEFAVMFLENTPIKLDAPAVEAAPAAKPKLKAVSEAMLTLFATYIHGRVGGVGPLVEAFRQAHPECDVPRAQLILRMKNQDFATKEMRANDYCWRWYIHPELAASLNINTEALLAARITPSATSVPSYHMNLFASPEKQQQQQQTISPSKPTSSPHPPPAAARRLVPLSPEKKRDSSQIVFQDETEKVQQKSSAVSHTK